MKTFLEYLKESIIDPHHPRLDSSIFQSDSPPRLRPLVRAQIQRGIANLESYSGIKVLDYRMIGSILTHRYTDDSDLDINVLIEGSLNNAVKAATNLSGKPVPGTRHVINFHVLNQRIVWNAANKDADGVFNVEENKFERVPSDRPFNVGMYWKDFTRVASTIDTLSKKLKEAVLDYDSLRLAHPNDLKHIRNLAIKHVREIEAAAVSLTDIYKIVKTSRDSIFEKGLTQKDIIRYGEKNRMPANVIYKLLEKYHYLKLLNSIADIIGHDNSLSPDELKELRNLFNPMAPK